MIYAGERFFHDDGVPETGVVVTDSAAVREDSLSVHGWSVGRDTTALEHATLWAIERKIFC